LPPHSHHAARLPYDCAWIKVRVRIVEVMGESVTAGWRTWRIQPLPWETRGCAKC
jgi:hypothetical protein